MGLQKHLLADVLGQLSLPNLEQDGSIDQRKVSAVELRKGGVVSAAGGLDDRSVRGLSHESTNPPLRIPCSIQPTPEASMSIDSGKRLTSAHSTHRRS